MELAEVAAEQEQQPDGQRAVPPQQRGPGGVEHQCEQQRRDLIVPPPGGARRARKGGVDGGGHGRDRADLRKGRVLRMRPLRMYTCAKLRWRGHEGALDLRASILRRSLFHDSLQSPAPADFNRAALSSEAISPAALQALLLGSAEL